MFGNPQYYHGAIRKYVIMFGNMFNEIEIVRYNASNQPTQQFRLPIAYGPREKFLSRLRTDPSLDREVALQLPRLSFEITNYTYDPSRNLNKLQKNIYASTDNDKVKNQQVPVPYNIDFSLYGMFGNQEDAVQTIEQILPFFRPEWVNTMKLVTDTNEYYDIPTIFTGMSIEDTYDGDFQTRRALIYTMNFVVKGYIFGPVKNSAVIKKSIINTFANTTATSSVNSKLTLTPGLLANGSPTTNATASVASSLISASDNYGFAFERENFFDSSGQ